MNDFNYLLVRLVLAFLGAGLYKDFLEILDVELFGTDAISKFPADGNGSW